MEEASKLASSFADDCMITITLEGAQTTYKVQKALLCSMSDYFKKALNGDFKESDDRTLRLPGCDEETFQFVLYWVTKKWLPDLFSAIRNQSQDSEPRNRMSVAAQVLLVKIWSFGEAYLMPRPQNDAMKSLMEIISWSRARPGAVREASTTTGADSAIREVLVREAIHDLYTGSYCDDEKDMLGAVPGFLAALAPSFPTCDCDSGDTNHEKKCIKPSRQDIEKYLVPEGED